MYFDQDEFKEWADFCRFGGQLKDRAIGFCFTLLLWSLEPEDAELRAGRCAYKYAPPNFMIRN